MSEPNIERFFRRQAYVWVFVWMGTAILVAIGGSPVTSLLALCSSAAAFMVGYWACAWIGCDGDGPDE